MSIAQDCGLKEQRVLMTVWRHFEAKKFPFNMLLILNFKLILFKPRYMLGMFYELHC